MNIILKIWIWITFFKNKGTLPSESKIVDPKIEYEIMSGAFIWEDEGLWDCPNHRLQNAFKYVVKHRTNLITGPDNDVRDMRSKKLDESIFKMAKQCFPNWIGFEDSRCSYNAELSERIKRIRKVSEWKIQKLMNEDISAKNEQ